MWIDLFSYWFIKSKRRAAPASTTRAHRDGGRDPLGNKKRTIEHIL